MAVRMQVSTEDDAYAELVSLRNWLMQEDELRGHVTVDVPEISAGQMGAMADALIVAVGSGGALTALAHAVRIWLQQRRSTVHVQIQDEESGRSFAASADHLDDPDAFVRTVLSHVTVER